MNILSQGSSSNRRRVTACLLFLVAACLCLTASFETRAQTPAETGTATSPAQPIPSPDRNTTGDGASKAASVATLSLTGRIVDESGEPVAGVPVAAFPTNYTSEGFRQAQLNTNTTDEQGNFKIDGLTPGLYNISAPLRGFVPDPNDAPPGRATPVYRAGDHVTVRLVKGGVITGSVTDANGEPLIAITVRAYFVRDLEGSDQRAGFGSGDQTDDRGVYRIYGLRQGVYVIVAGNDSTSGPGMRIPSPYEGEAPTYYPAGTRDTATEVTVRAGQEMSGIDIRYRGERGRRITGTVTSAQGQAPDAGVSVVLTHANTGTQAGFAYTPPGAAFSFEGVADGEYEVQARSTTRNGNGSISTSQRVLMSGADVTGVKLTLSPLAAASGNLVIEPLSEAARASEVCKERRSSLLPQESIIAARRDETAAMKNQRTGRLTPQRLETSPGADGVFTLRNLEPGRYRFETHPADENWYVRDIQLPAAPPPTAATSARPATARRESAAVSRKDNADAAAPSSREWLELKSGQETTGLFIRVAEGAASLSGRLAPAAEGATLPPLAETRIHLVPAEREQTDNVIRYYETAPASDGAFALKSLAPGKYLILARSAESAAPARPAAWDAATRGRLRREAEAANLPIELQACQRMNDFALRFPSPRE